jgi:VWFA-related protein
VVYQDAREVLPLQPVAGIARELKYRPREVSQFAETAAINDAMAAALLRSTPPDRRHLVMMFTDGIDGTSVVPHALLLEAAKESDAVLHLARRLTEGEQALQRNPRSSNHDSQTLLWPAEPYLVEDIARATGGTVRHPRDDESMVGQFKQILDEFRQSYILQYRPTGVSATGWHQISVRLKKPGKYDVRARRGYFAGPG